MDQDNNSKDVNAANIKELLTGSGYSDKAISYYIDKKNMGTISNADQVSELTGTCGDTMKIYLKIEEGIVKDARIQVVGCPGAVASAMAAMDMIRGKTLKEVKQLKDRDIFRELEDIPDQKQHCIRLTNKTIQKAVEEYLSGNSKNKKG